MIGLLMLTTLLCLGALILLPAARWVAHIGLGLVVLGDLVAGSTRSADTPALAALLGLAALAYMAAALLDSRGVWALLAGLLLPSAIYLGTFVGGPHVQITALAFALLALAYLGLGAGLEQHRPGQAQVLVLIAPLLGSVALVFNLIDSLFKIEVPQIVLLLVIALGALMVALIKRGRLAWLGAWRTPISLLGLFATAGLLGIWLLILCSIWEMGIGIALLPLVLACIVGVRWWM